jgi:hypothetical protein
MVIENSLHEVSLIVLDWKCFSEYKIHCPTTLFMNTKCGVRGSIVPRRALPGERGSLFPRWV